MWGATGSPTDGQPLCVTARRINSDRHKHLRKDKEPTQESHPRSEFETMRPGGLARGMSRALLKLSGSLVHDYATISDDAPSPNRASRARRAATSAGISCHPCTRRNPFAASSTPAATQRSTIVPPRQRFTWRCTWRVRLRRLSMAFVVASDRWRRSDRRCFRHQLLLPRPYLVLTKPLRLDMQCQRGASVKIGWKYLDD